MEIYTLTHTDTQKCFSPIGVQTFVSKENAHQAMIEELHQYLTECHSKVTIEELNAKNGYENDGICVGYSYASVDSRIWEIFRTEIYAKDVIIAAIIEQYHNWYVLPKRYDNVIHKLLNEYSEQELADALYNGELLDFCNDRFIGEALYENALANLGGITTEEAYEKICIFIDTDLINLATKERFDFYADDKYEQMTCQNKWLLAMIMLCAGDKKLIHDVRTEIDKSLSPKYKIFQKEDEMSDTESLTIKDRINDFATFAEKLEKCCKEAVKANAETPNQEIDLRVPDTYPSVDSVIFPMPTTIQDYLEIWEQVTENLKYINETFIDFYANDDEQNLAFFLDVTLWVNWNEQENKYKIS